MKHARGKCSAAQKTWVCAESPPLLPHPAERDRSTLTLVTAAPAATPVARNIHVGRLHARSLQRTAGFIVHRVAERVCRLPIVAIWPVRVNVRRTNNNQNDDDRRGDLQSARGFAIHLSEKPARANQHNTQHVKHRSVTCGQDCSI